MEHYSETYKKFLSALNRLQETIEMLKAVEKYAKKIGKTENAFREILLDSLFIRFRFTAYLFYEHMQQHVSREQGLWEQFDPTPVIKAAHKMNMLSTDEAQKAIEMIPNLKIIASSDTTKKVQTNILSYYELMKRCGEKLAPISD